MTNCPNCGAPVKGYQCEYCGTVFAERVDMSMVDIDTYIKKKRTLEAARAELEVKILEAKNRSLDNAITIQRLYEDAIYAMRRYGRG